ncbi:MAG: DUF2341 domain-containing protein, partial [Aquabacterium sp.]|nr:DUF2341 domain-containing protein [Aquabacterium sp.]
MPAPPVISTLRPWRAACGRVLALLALAALPLSALAWWDATYKQRTVVTLNTGPQGVTLAEPISGAAVPVRLHSGNFDFVGAKPDGSDLRVVGGDDKTALKFSVERFDGANELAVVWVQVPTVAPGSDKNLVHVYAGNAQAAALPATPVVDAGAVAGRSACAAWAPLTYSVALPPPSVAARWAQAPGGMVPPSTRSAPRRSTSLPPSSASVSWPWASKVPAAATG